MPDWFEQLRLMRVALKTPATKGPKRARRLAKATAAKTRQVYLTQLGAVLRQGELAEVGDLSFAGALMVRQHAITFGEAWSARQVAW